MDSLKELATASLSRWPLPAGCTATLINVSENATFRAPASLDGDAAAGKWALRVHREGYHSHRAMFSELTWAAALRAAGKVTVTPVPVPGRDGELIQQVMHQPSGRPRNLVLFDWEAGNEPAEGDVAAVALLGKLLHACTSMCDTGNPQNGSSATRGILTHVLASTRTGEAGGTPWASQRKWSTSLHALLM
jgi:Ser/Thr protein kinase RdoA (MazF antagonist)